MCTNLSESIQLSAGFQTWRSAEAAGVEEDRRALHSRLEIERERESRYSLDLDFVYQPAVTCETDSHRRSTRAT